MACINPDGSISQTAKTLLKALQVPLEPREISQNLNVPLFKVRSSLREMIEAGLVQKTDEQYMITDKGRSLLE